jgi:hypothetical protein
VSTQAKPINEVVQDFEQSLRTYRPSTRRVYVAGARAAIRAASLELWQSTSLTDLLASIGKSPTEKRARISPFLDFLGGGEPKQAVSEQDSAALQNWVIQGIAKQMRLVKNPSIATRRDEGLIAALCAAPARGSPRKWPERLPNSHGKRSASVGCGDPGTLLRSCLALLARLEGAAGPAGPTAALPQISRVEPITAAFPRGPTALPWARAALHNALRRLSVAGERSSSSGPITPEKIRVAFLRRSPSIQGLPEGFTPL